MPRPTAIHAPARTTSPRPGGPGLVHRSCGCGHKHAGPSPCADCRKKAALRRDAGRGPTPTGVPGLVLEVIRAPGRPLDVAARGFFEPRFGRDFSRVRVHTDARAAASAASVGARAYTVGDHIAFADGQYAPGQPEGRRLLAHELAHVVQQGGSPGQAPAHLELAPTWDRAEREAVDVAARIARGEPSGAIAGDGAAGLVARSSRSGSPDAGTSGSESGAGPAASATSPAPAVSPPETGVCGPDLTTPIAGAIALTKRTFAAWSQDKREEACSSIVSLNTADIAWDIPALHRQKWLEVYRPECDTWTTYPRCGWFESDPDFAKDRQIAASITIDNNSCHLAGSVNYVIFGVMCKLCYDNYSALAGAAMTRSAQIPIYHPLDIWSANNEAETMDESRDAFSESAMLRLIWAYKGHILFIRSASGNYEAAKLWSSAGYNGWDGKGGAATPVADRAKCATSCPVAYGSRGTRTGGFAVAWFPHGWGESLIGP